MLVFVVTLSSLSIAVNAQTFNDPTASVISFSPQTCEVTAQVTFPAAADASYVVPPAVPFRDWHWRLFTSGVVGIDPTSSIHGLPGVIINREDPTAGGLFDGGLAFIAAGATASYNARVDLCATFSTLPAGQYSADLTSANSVTDDCAPPDCLDSPLQIRTWNETTPPFIFVVVENSDGTRDRFGDNCPEDGVGAEAGAAKTGCPNALRAQVTSKGLPFDGAVVRVFNRNDAGYQEVQGKNAHETPPTLAMNLFERNAGAVGACITGKKTVQGGTPVAGQCEAGLAFPYDAVAIVKLTRPTSPNTTETIYVKSPFGPPHDYKKDGVATKLFTVK